MRIHVRASGNSIIRQIREREYKINRAGKTSSVRYGIKLKSSYKVSPNYENLKISTQ